MPTTSGDPVRTDVDQRTNHHGNAFGLLRLLFATTVIVSHSYLITGRWQDEPVHRLFGGTDLGAIAVNGFFAVSGFLITGSLLGSSSLRSYLLKRIARIYPAYIVAFLVCVLIVAPLDGASISPGAPTQWITWAKAMTLLEKPFAPGVFTGTVMPELNASAWTIAFEFRAYLALIVLWFAGALRRPFVLLGLAGLLLLGKELLPQAMMLKVMSLPYVSIWLGDPLNTARLMAIFLAGAAAYLAHERLRFPTWALYAAGVLLAASFGVPKLATAGFAVFGTYLVIGLARRGTGTWAERVNNRNDISYGTYLYAWPIQKLLFAWGLHSVGGVLVVTVIASLCFGYLSWVLVERPAMLRLGRARRAWGTKDAPRPA